jgi:hypothetical protein
MPSKQKQTKKAVAQSVAVKAPSAPHAAAAPPVGAAAAMTKTIETLRAEAASAQQFAAWAATADDDEAPALLFYPKPTGKGVWSWQLKAAHDAQVAAAALAAAEAAEAAAEAAKPTPIAEAACDDDGPYVPRAEAPEVTAARLARYAADGRSPSGVLLSSSSAEHQNCSCSSCGFSTKQQSKRTKALTDEECQAAVDLFGWHHGAELIMAQNEGFSLDDLYGSEMQAAWDHFCAVRRQCAEAVEAAEKARIEANWRRCVVEQAQVEARRCLKRGQAVQKNGRICTRCYSCEGNKTTDWEDGGKKARPSTLQVSSECFTHVEFLAGRIREDCPFLHTGDAGWHAEWDSNFLWDPLHPESMPVAKHIRKREGDALLCISEKSAGYLPVHLGGKEQGMDARQWRATESAAAGGGGAAPSQRAAPEGRFAALGGGGGGPSQRAAGGGGGAGGGARAGPGSGWARK